MASLESLTTQQPAPDVNSIGQLFDRIAPTYNILNHILSLGQDFYWRRKLVDCIDKTHKLRVLDIATGTGDLLISLLRRNPNILEAVGLDISENMLTLCRKKIIKHGLTKRASLIHADVNSCPFADGTFDVITMSFGIRNTPNPFKTLGEIGRLLKPGGTVTILEFSMPSNRIFKSLYLLYLRRSVPLIGRIISGDNHAYKYLNTSIEHFDNVNSFRYLMQKAGFADIHTTRLTLSLVCLYMGHKPAC
jgi:demethylmenaquinone methyltransferase/2-methoxy-6-polyprenyl-1,4-benzoquinol methylase